MQHQPPAREQPHGVRPAGRRVEQGRAVTADRGPGGAGAAVHPVDPPAPAVRGEAPPAGGGHERRVARHAVHGGQATGHVGQGEQAGVEERVRRVARPGGPQVEGVHGKLVGLREQGGEQGQGTDRPGGGCAVETRGSVGEVGADAVAVAPQRGEDLLAGRMPVGGDHAGVGCVDVRGPTLPARAGGGDEPGHRVVVVPHPEVGAHLLGPPAGQARGTVQVAGARRREERVPGPEEHGADDITACVQHATRSGRGGHAHHSTTRSAGERAEVLPDRGQHRPVGRLTPTVPLGEVQGG